MTTVQDTNRIIQPYGRDLRPEARWLGDQRGQVWVSWKLVDGREVHGHRALDRVEIMSVRDLLERASASSTFRLTEPDS